MGPPAKPQPQRWIPTYIILLMSLALLTLALLLLYLRTGSDAYLSGAILMALIATYTGWSFARLLSLRSASRTLVTLLKCSSCGYETARAFKDGDRLFSEADACPRCGGKMVVEGIFLRSATKGYQTV